MQSEKKDDQQRELPPIDFTSFIMSLGTQAMMYLGDVKPPPGMDVKVDREAARHMIDVIEMLKNKSKGNLEPGEEKFVEEILHNLRLRFLNAGK